MTDPNDDLIYLSIGPDYDDGQLMPRSELPNDALRTAFDVNGTNLDGGSARMYEVWAVER